MNVRNQYNTRQRSRLLEYMQTVPGEHFTAKDVCDYFQSCGTPIGVATVYRQLERMVEEGLHCKCEKCGKLIHLHCEELVQIRSHLKEEHHFTLDPLRTVFYGLCEDCAAGR